MIEQTSVFHGPVYGKNSTPPIFIQTTRLDQKVRSRTSTKSLRTMVWVLFEFPMRTYNLPCSFSTINCFIRVQHPRQLSLQVALWTTRGCPVDNPPTDPISEHRYALGITLLRSKFTLF